MHSAVEHLPTRRDNLEMSLPQLIREDSRHSGNFMPLSYPPKKERIILLTQQQRVIIRRRRLELHVTPSSELICTGRNMVAWD